MSKNFNFEEFDKLCRDTLGDEYEEMDVLMAAEDIEREEAEHWTDQDSEHPDICRPGEIGAVVTHLTFRDAPDSPEAA